MLDRDYLLGQELFDLNAQAGGDAQTELDIDTAEVAELTRDNCVAFGASDALHRGDDVVDKMLPLGVGQHVAEEIPRLGVVVVVSRGMAVVPVSYRGLQGEWGLFVALIDSNVIEAIRPIIRATATVAINPHKAVTLVIGHGKGTPVDRELFVVDAQAIAVRVGVRQQASLEHLVWRVADPIHDMGRGKRSLLHVGEVIGRDLVEFHDSYIDKREFSVWPDLREIEGIPVETPRLRLGHDLDF